MSGKKRTREDIINESKREIAEGAKRVRLLTGEYNNTDEEIFNAIRNMQRALETKRLDPEEAINLWIIIDTFYNTEVK